MVFDLLIYFPFPVIFILFSVNPSNHLPQSNTSQKNHPMPLSLRPQIECSKERNWSDCELYKLSAFIVHHRDKFDTQRIRKENKIYAVLSRYIQTRNSNQCRNYVQKLLYKFRSYEQIINFFRQSLPLFERQTQEQASDLNKIEFSSKITFNQSKEVSSLLQKIDEKKADDLVKEEYIGEIELGMRPTDISYHEDPVFPNSKQTSSISQSQHQYCSHKNHYLPLINTKKTSSFMSETFVDGHNQGNLEDISWKWQYCHNLFLQWTSKTLSLLEKRQSFQSNVFE